MIMETVEADTVHASVCSTLSFINGEDMDELSKEKEEELLYAEEDGDEDALSDDSLHLRLSDDDVEAEEGVSNFTDSNHTSSVNEKPESEEAVAVNIKEDNINKEEVSKKEENTAQKKIAEEEEECSVIEKPAIKNDVSGCEVSNKENSEGCAARKSFSKEDSEEKMGEESTRKPSDSAECTTVKIERQQNPVSSSDTHACDAQMSKDNSNNEQETDDTSKTEASESEEQSKSSSNSSRGEENKMTSVCNDTKKEAVTEDDIAEKVVNVQNGDNAEIHHKEFEKDCNAGEAAVAKNSDFVCNDILNESVSENVLISTTTAHDASDKVEKNCVNNTVSNDCDVNNVDNSKVVLCVNDNVESKSEEVKTFNVKEESSPVCNGETSQESPVQSPSSNRDEARKEELKDSTEEVPVVEVERNHSGEEDSKCNLHVNNEESSKPLENASANDVHNIEKQLTNGEIKELKETEEIVQSNSNDTGNAVSDSLSDRNPCLRNLLSKDNEVVPSHALPVKSNNVRLEKRPLQEGDVTMSVKTCKLDISKDDSAVRKDATRQKQSESEECLIIENTDSSACHRNAQPVKNEVQTEKDNAPVHPKSEAIGQTDSVNEQSTGNSSGTSTCELKDVNNVANVSETTKTEQPVRRRRRTNKMTVAAQEAASEAEKQGQESGRQKRRTAKNAEEIIRKKFLGDADTESSDDSDKFVLVNKRMNPDARPLSPPSLKRCYSEFDTTVLNGNIKKVKVNSEAVKEKNSEIKKLDYVHKFFRRDLKEKLPKLKQEELEELLIQKIVETITMRGEIGRLREQARISEKNQEATRARCQQLAKQIKDFEMVLSRYAVDRRSNNDKPTAPIKINRSVGLQVNFITEPGIQNLRQLQQNSYKSPNVTPSQSVNPSTHNEQNQNASSPRRGIKIRSPRRSEASAVSQTTTITQSQIQSLPVTSTVTPAALVVTKPIESQHSTPNQANSFQPILANQQQQQQLQQQQSHQLSQISLSTLVFNGKISSPYNRQGSLPNLSTLPKSKPGDLIDLTDEEEKNKSAVNVTTASVTTASTEQQPAGTPPKVQAAGFQRILQTIPANMTITTQPTNIRVLPTTNHPTPAALVNNMSTSRVAYVMQGPGGQPRQVLITSNANQIRPPNSNTRPPFSAVSYKTGISTVANGTVRLLTTSAVTNVPMSKHPAPLPDCPNYATNPAWKLPPPAPSLKISKVSNGIVLSWNMALSDKYADIASYQLYAYQEVPGMAPNTALWKKVGDVRALPLPMACTLTQFSEGNNYYFAVRAVDTHSRKGLYSTPGNISL